MYGGLIISQGLAQPGTLLCMYWRKEVSELSLMPTVALGTSSSSIFYKYSTCKNLQNIPTFGSSENLT